LRFDLKNKKRPKRVWSVQSEGKKMILKRAGALKPWQAKNGEGTSQLDSGRKKRLYHQRKVGLQKGKTQNHENLLRRKWDPFGEETGNEEKEFWSRRGSIKRRR